MTEYSTDLVNLGIELDKGLRRINRDPDDEWAAILVRAGADSDVLITGQASYQDHKGSQEDSETGGRAGDLLQVQLGFLGESQ